MIIIPLGYLLLGSDYNGISSLGYVILALYFARPLFSPYYVRWNARSLMIKRGIFRYTTIRFTDITSIQYDRQRLSIATLKGKEIEWDLAAFNQVDIAKLLRILGQDTSAMSKE